MSGVAPIDAVFMPLTERGPIGYGEVDVSTQSTPSIWIFLPEVCREFYLTPENAERLAIQLNEQAAVARTNRG